MIVKRFKKSNSALAILQESQKRLGLDELMPIQDVKTRWNSSFYMIERIEKIKDPLLIALSKIRDLPQLLADDWELIEDLVELLFPLEQVTRTICGEKYSSASMIIPIFGSAITGITNLILKSKEALLFRANCVKFLNDRFRDIEFNPILTKSTILDPRFKDAGFANNLRAMEAIKLIRHELRSLNSPQIEDQIQFTKLDMLR
jgi:zinc finger BED domain-containing protein 1 (E3 SUMO-protein ligase ZBED1)